MLSILCLLEELLSCWPPGRLDVVDANRHPWLGEVPVGVELEVEVEVGGDKVEVPTPLPSPEEFRL